LGLWPGVVLVSWGGVVEAALGVLLGEVDEAGVVLQGNHFGWHLPLQNSKYRLKYCGVMQLVPHRILSLGQVPLQGLHLLRHVPLQT